MDINVTTTQGIRTVINNDNIALYTKQLDGSYNLLLSSGDKIQIIDEPTYGGPPSEYEHINSLQSTGTQYLDTGYNDPNGFRVVTKFMQTDMPTSWVAIMGTELESNTTIDRNSVLSYIDYAASPEYSGLRFNLGSNNIYVSNYMNELNKWYDLDASSVISNRYIMRDGVLETESDLITIGQNQHNLSTLSLYLFALHRSDGAKLLNKCALGPTQFYNSNNELINSFIPVRRISDGKLGMYDAAKKVFLTNKGTGDFIEGPKIS